MELALALLFTYLSSVTGSCDLIARFLGSVAFSEAPGDWKGLWTTGSPTSLTPNPPTTPPLPGPSPPILHPFLPNTFTHTSSPGLTMTA